MIKQFLHIGFEVEDLDKAIGLYESLGFTVTHRFEKPEPKAKAAMMTSLGGTGLEIWQFIDTEHPLVQYIRRHMAVLSDNLEADLEMLQQQGCEVVIPITKGVVLTYAYVRDPSGNYIEVAKQ